MACNLVPSQSKQEQRQNDSSPDGWVGHISATRSPYAFTTWNRPKVTRPWSLATRDTQWGPGKTQHMTLSHPSHTKLGCFCPYLCYFCITSLLSLFLSCLFWQLPPSFSHSCPVCLNLFLCHPINCTCTHILTSSSFSSPTWANTSSLGSGISNKLKSAWPAQATLSSSTFMFCLCVPACLGYIG